MYQYVRVLRFYCKEKNMRFAEIKIREKPKDKGMVVCNPCNFVC